MSIQFMVQIDGTVTDIKVLKSPDFLLSEESIKLLEKSPKWEPARIYNRPVKYQHTQNITFRLE